MAELPKLRLPSVFAALQEKKQDDSDVFSSQIRSIHDSYAQLSSTSNAIGSSSLTRATPRTFVAFVDTIGRIFDSNMADQKESIEHLLGGLQKLREAESQVKELSTEAAKQQKVLDLLDFYYGSHF